MERRERREQIDFNKLEQELFERSETLASASVSLGFASTYLHNIKGRYQQKIPIRALNLLNYHFGISYDDIKPDPVEEIKEEPIVTNDATTQQVNINIDYTKLGNAIAEVVAKNEAIDYKRLGGVIVGAIRQGMDKWLTENYEDLDKLINNSVYSALNGALVRNGLSETSDKYKQ